MTADWEQWGLFRLSQTGERIEFSVKIDMRSLLAVKKAYIVANSWQKSVKNVPVTLSFFRSPPTPNPQTICCKSRLIPPLNHPILRPPPSHTPLHPFSHSHPIVLSTMEGMFPPPLVAGSQPAPPMKMDEPRYAPVSPLPLPHKLLQRTSLSI